MSYLHIALQFPRRCHFSVSSFCDSRFLSLSLSVFKTNKDESKTAADPPPDHTFFPPWHVFILFTAHALTWKNTPRNNGGAETELIRTGWSYENSLHSRQIKQLLCQGVSFVFTRQTDYFMYLFFLYRFFLFWVNFFSLLNTHPGRCVRRKEWLVKFVWTCAGKSFLHVHHFFSFAFMMTGTQS